MSHLTSNGRVFGATLLVAGCCIGAGMLGLPVLTALGGFQPTLVLFFLCWLFMAITGMLFLEVNLWFKEEVNIVTMATRTLGLTGKVLGSLLFAFLFYSLMVAYISACGQLVADFLHAFLGISVPEWMGSLSLTLLFGLFVYCGTQLVDRFNRFLMGGLVLSYLLLVGVGARHIDFSLLQHVDWRAALVAVPAMIISFGYHNLIPSLSTYLNHDAKKLRFVLFVGSLIPLVIYLIWEGLILGLVPLEGPHGFRGALDQGEMATRALRNAVGLSWVVGMAESFAFFAIVTSFLTVALSFVDFLADGLHIKKEPKGKLGLCVLALAPPFMCALIYPKIFLIALSYAGAFGAVILFGIIPAAMVWSGRYVKKMDGIVLVPGGKGTLVIVILLSLLIVFLQMKGG